MRGTTIKADYYSTAASSSTFLWCGEQESTNNVELIDQYKEMKRKNCIWKEYKKQWTAEDEAELTGLEGMRLS